MSNRDWDFAIGDFGDPLADIKDWMLRPYPKCINPETYEPPKLEE